MKSLVSIIVLVAVIRQIPHDLEIYFVDVGQGDCTLIVTPNDKTILIDGGGSPTYNVGKNTLIPYLLDRKIKELDYIIVSHFDEDHVGGILNVLKELEVNQVIINKQPENSENYLKFLDIVKQKKKGAVCIGCSMAGTSSRVSPRKISTPSFRRR